MLQEQHQTNQIYTDFNIGMHTNLVDRDVYKLNVPENSDAKAEADALKAKMSEKLKYILSDKETYDPFENKKQVKLSKQIIIPQKFIKFD